MKIKQVTAVSTAYDALDFLSNNEVDLLITDWNMPHVSGFSLLKTIRALPQYDDLPVIMVTANSEPEQIEQAMNAGATRYLVKPINSTVLEMTVAYCQLWRSERQIRAMKND